jgi:DNA-directed RNA polymerase subunit RPC12/RpoP
MECPHCHQELLISKCPHCGSDIPMKSRYCMNCGVNLEERLEDIINADDDVFDPENRILCPDGTCTGIIVNGKCIECGRPFDEDK